MSNVVWKILWSTNGYRGWDDKVYREYFLGGKAISLGFGFFIDYGFGFEWWNFYEGFSNEFYFGYAPPVHSMRPRRFVNGGVIFFISRNAIGNWYVIFQHLRGFCEMFWLLGYLKISIRSG